MHRAPPRRLLQEIALVAVIAVVGRAHPRDALEARNALLRGEGVEDAGGELVAGAAGGVAAELVVVDAALGGRGGGGEGAEGAEVGLEEGGEGGEGGGEVEGEGVGGDAVVVEVAAGGTVSLGGGLKNMIC